MMKSNLSLTIKFIAFLLLICCFLDSELQAQAQLVSKEKVIFYTQEWEGDRDQYGRPMVSDEILELMKFVGLEEAWGTIRGAGYTAKYEGDWKIMNPEERMIGRALTSAYLPSSPELQKRMEEIAIEQGLGEGKNQMPIRHLKKGDVYVSNGYGKIKGGPIIGDNLGAGIYANSGNGLIVNGSFRDLGGMREIEGFNAWVKDWHPSVNQEMMLFSINNPIRIGEAVVLPGDVVLAVEQGVLFIPPHLAERVIDRSEVTRVTDSFRIMRILDGKYNLKEIYHAEWSDEINQDFFSWLQLNRNLLHNEKGVRHETINNMIRIQSRNRQDW